MRDTVEKQNPLVDQPSDVKRWIARGKAAQRDPDPRLWFMAGEVVSLEAIALRKRALYTSDWGERAELAKQFVAAVERLHPISDDCIRAWPLPETKDYI